MKFVVGENRQTPLRPPRNQHGVTETRTRDPSGGRRASNRLRYEAALNEYIKLNYLNQHFYESQPSL